jgi:hypothetical protein
VVRSEELEVDRAALVGDRTERFLAACGLAPGRVSEALTAAQGEVDRSGEALVRVRLGEDQPEVEVVPHNRGVLHLTRVADPPTAAQLARGGP